MPTTQEQNRRNDAKQEIRNFIRKNASDSSSIIEGGKYLFQRAPGIILRKTKHLEVSINLCMTGSVSFYLYSYDADRKIDITVRKGLKLPNDGRFVFEWHKSKAWTKKRLVCYLHCKDIDWRKLTNANLKTLTNGYNMLVAALNEINALD